MLVRLVGVVGGVVGRIWLWGVLVVGEFEGYN
jgi:hypothetical protein